MSFKHSTFNKSKYLRQIKKEQKKFSLREYYESLLVRLDSLSQYRDTNYLYKNDILEKDILDLTLEIEKTKLELKLKKSSK